MNLTDISQEMYIMRYLYQVHTYEIIWEESDIIVNNFTDIVILYFDKRMKNRK